MKKARTARPAILLLLILVCGFLLIVTQQALMRANNREGERETERDLYLPEPGYLQLVSMGHDGLMADLALAKAMTYFGSHYHDRQNFAFKHLEKLFITAIEMDPRNREAVLMAGNILSDIDVHAAINVLKRGMGHHPQHWKFPEMIGYHYFFRLNDPIKAAQYYEMAAGMPGHPPYVPSLSGKFYKESGRYEEAIRVLYNFYSTTPDPRLKKSFKDSIEALQEQVKNRDFQLNATVLKVVDGVTVAFRPDPNNPQYQFLDPVETLRITGLEAMDAGSGGPWRKLAKLFQLDFARSILSGANASVRIAFERTPGGRLKQDSRGRFYGSVTLKNNRSYRTLMEQSGITGGIHRLPPEPMTLDLNEIYRHAGKVVSLRFRVHRVEEMAGRIYLRAASQYRNTFSAVIPARYRGNFVPPGTDGPGHFKSFEGKTITIKGLALIRNRRVEMNLYYSIQVQ